MLLKKPSYVHRLYMTQPGAYIVVKANMVVLFSEENWRQYFLVLILSYPEGIIIYMKAYYSSIASKGGARIRVEIETFSSFVLRF
jgi:hypothetical protein